MVCFSAAAKLECLLSAAMSSNARARESSARLEIHKQRSIIRPELDGGVVGERDAQFPCRCLRCSCQGVGEWDSRIPDEGLSPGQAAQLGDSAKYGVSGIVRARRPGREQHFDFQPNSFCHGHDRKAVRRQSRLRLKARSSRRSCRLVMRRVIQQPLQHRKGATICLHPHVDRSATASPQLLRKKGKRHHTWLEQNLAPPPGKAPPTSWWCAPVWISEMPDNFGDSDTRTG